MSLMPRNYGAQRYAQKRELIQKRLDAGVVAEKYPQVSSMVINLVYYQDTRNSVLMERTIYVNPESPAFFRMKCFVKDCMKGEMDMTSEVKKMVSKRVENGKGKLICKGEAECRSCDYSTIHFKIRIGYSKKKNGRS